MRKVVKDIPWNADAQQRVREELISRINALSLADLEVVLAFTRDVVIQHDPDVVADFREWHADPRIGSILQLAAGLSDELREQLLFVAEDFYASERPKRRG